MYVLIICMNSSVGNTLDILAILILGDKICNKCTVSVCVVTLVASKLIKCMETLQKYNTSTTLSRLGVGLC